MYKAWYPLAQRWLDFDGVLVSLGVRSGSPAAGWFTARLQVPGPGVDGREVTAFGGRWLVRNGLVLTATVVGSPPADAPSRTSSV